MQSLIAFTGYAGAGKDEAAIPLIAAGYLRRCFGDIIKRQMDGLVRKHFGFSAFTDNRAEKEAIRPLLEAWGDANYNGVMSDYFYGLVPPVVNTRLVRVREAREWKKRGGVIWEIMRPGFQGATDWERARLKELYQDGLVDSCIYNTSTIEELHQKVAEEAELADCHCATS